MQQYEALYCYGERFLFSQLWGSGKPHLPAIAMPDQQRTQGVFCV